MVQEDVKELGINAVDLVLIHHPAPTDLENQQLWRGLESAVQMNLTRSIGLISIPYFAFACSRYLCWTHARAFELLCHPAGCYLVDYC